MLAIVQRPVIRRPHRIFLDTVGQTNQFFSNRRLARNDFMKMGYTTWQGRDYISFCVYPKGQRDTSRQSVYMSACALQTLAKRFEAKALPLEENFREGLAMITVFGREFVNAPV